MNCKPDQLCRVTRGLNKEALVRTIHRCGCLGDFATAAAGEGGMWRTEALQHVTDEKDGEQFHGILGSLRVRSSSWESSSGGQQTKSLQA